MRAAYEIFCFQTRVVILLETAQHNIHTAIQTQDKQIKVGRFKLQFEKFFLAQNFLTFNQQRIKCTYLSVFNRLDQQLFINEK